MLRRGNRVHWGVQVKHYLKMKHRETLFIALIGFVLIISFQNCSNGVGFNTGGASVTKSGVSGEGQDPMTVLNPPPSPDEDDNDSDIDYDHNGKRVMFNCVTGVRKGWDDGEFGNASDLSLLNQVGLIFHYRKPLRNVQVNNVVGSVAIRNAWKTSEYLNVKGIVSALRSVEVTKASEISAVVSTTATIRLGELSNVSSTFACVSGAEIGKASNIKSAYTKIRGRSAGTGVRAHANEISYLSGTFISLAHIDVTRINNVNGGEFIIRDAVIDELSNFNGGLTLINSQVKSLKNTTGILRTYNSVITNRENVTGMEVSLPDIQRRP